MKFQYGSYYDQEVTDVAETDPHYVIYCYENIRDHGIPVEVFQRAVELVHGEINDLEDELDKEGDDVVVLQEFLHTDNSYVDEYGSDYEQYC